MELFNLLSTGNYFGSMREIPIEPVLWIIVFYVTARILYKAVTEGD